MSHNVSCITQLIVLINRLNDLTFILHTQTTKVSHLKKDTVRVVMTYILFYIEVQRLQPHPQRLLMLVSVGGAHSTLYTALDASPKVRYTLNAALE